MPHNIFFFQRIFFQPLKISLHVTKYILDTIVPFCVWESHHYVQTTKWDFQMHLRYVVHPNIGKNNFNSPSINIAWFQGGF
jgi:hypothetical protein